MADKVTTKTTYDISYNQSNPNVNKLIKKTLHKHFQKNNPLLSIRKPLDFF